MKYTDRFFQNIDILQHARIGMEFEFYMKDISYYKTLEVINSYFDGVIVRGFKEYHPDFTPSAKEWLISPDLSGGSNMVELVTGAIPYIEAKMYIVAIMRFIQEYAYTTEKCAVHYNISFAPESDKNLNQLNMLKLILTTDEDEIYRDYPNRKNNIYAKSVKSIIPYKDFDHVDVPINVVVSRLKLPNDKYYGINFLHVNNEQKSQRLEFRYIGGLNYEMDYGKILKYLDKFIINTYNCLDEDFNEYEIDILDNYLSNNISNYTKLSDYDNFLITYPDVKVMINQEVGYDKVKLSYSLFYETLFSFLECVDKLENCIINYVSDTQRLEIVDTTISAKAPIYNIDFHNCKISNSIISKSIIGQCVIDNCQIQSSDIFNSDLDKSKIIQSKTIDCELVDCYFVESLLDSRLSGQNSVFRSGEIGERGVIEKEVKIATKSDNFFNTTVVSTEDDETLFTDFKDKFKTSLLDLKKLNQFTK
jgi:hypothetical protein